MLEIGLLFFLLVITLAFWLLIFLGVFALPYALTLHFINKVSPKLVEKITGRKDD